MKTFIIALSVFAFIAVSAPKAEASAVTVTICQNGATQQVSGIQAFILIAQHKATYGACPVVPVIVPKVHKAGHYNTLVRLGILSAHTTVSENTIGSENSTYKSE